MTAFVAMLFTMQLGLGASPIDRAAVSLREEAVAVAALHVGESPSDGATVQVREKLTPSYEQPRRRVLTREDWMNMLTDALSNQTLANAAMWVANQPVNVTVSQEKFFVSVRIATP